MNNSTINYTYERYCQEYTPLNTEEKQKLYIIANALINRQLNHLFELKPKHINIYLQYLERNNDQKEIVVKQLSQETSLSENTIKKIIKKAIKEEKNYITNQLAHIYAKNYQLNRINIITCLNLTELEALTLYRLKIGNIETIISNTKEEFLQKLIEYANKNNTDKKFIENLYKKIYYQIHKLDLAFIDELDEKNPLKEYLTLVILISNNNKYIDSNKEKILGLEILKSKLFEILNKYKDNILETISQIQPSFKDIELSNMNETEYKNFLEEQIKKLEKIINEYSKINYQKYETNEIYLERKKEFIKTKNKLSRK